MSRDTEDRSTSRRALLRYGLAAGAATALGGLGGRGLAANLMGAPGAIGTAVNAEFPLCLTAADGAAPTGPLRPLKLAWNASAICTAAAPVAKETGIFARHGLDVDFVNFGSSTEQLLEAIATGKADAGIGMALRWLKPLEQGFDVKITAGVHGGCLRLLGDAGAGVTSVAALKGKTIAVSDQASPGKNFFSIYLAELGIDPVKDVEWRQYPLEALPLAIQKGEAQALADADPRTWIWIKESNGKLVEIATNLSGKYADRTCCIIGVRGSLVRDERPVATALTRAILEGAHKVGADPELAARVFAGYGGKGSVDDLVAMLNSQDHHHSPINTALKQQLALYADELKLVQVMKPTTNSQRFAEKIYVDVLS
ncbi:MULTISPECIES: ABC transporter substrate-binding protein [unclassified Xanthobacter]|uniref:ABC transporter substrate-binding protein n=1 Tax=unclassified Xanthobacter TaxID=2623496 RepID=UPI001EDDF1CD|nr:MULTISPECIES: ABC transporter substrate-binding protein [unclassified Xanthobacter]